MFMFIDLYFCYCIFIFAICYGRQESDVLIITSLFYIQYIMLVVAGSLRGVRGHY